MQVSGPDEWAFFYGVTPDIRRLWNQAVNRGRALYCDNSYFDVTRGEYFRITRNARQLTGIAAGNEERMRAQGIVIEPWKRGGDHIVVVEQNHEFLDAVGAGQRWLRDTLIELRRATKRPIVLREATRAKLKARESFAESLVGAHALVTHMSAAANVALAYGVPAFCTGACAASPLARKRLDLIEQPIYPDGREEWAAGLAANQWTLDEMRLGTAWRHLMGE